MTTTICRFSVGCKQNAKQDSPGNKKRPLQQTVLYVGARKKPRLDLTTMATITTSSTFISLKTTTTTEKTTLPSTIMSLHTVSRRRKQQEEQQQQPARRPQKWHMFLPALLAHVLNVYCGQLLPLMRCRRVCKTWANVLQPDKLRLVPSMRRIYNSFLSDMSLVNSTLVRTRWNQYTHWQRPEIDTFVTAHADGSTVANQVESNLKSIWNRCISCTSMENITRCTTCWYQVCYKCSQLSNRFHVETLDAYDNLMRHGECVCCRWHRTTDNKPTFSKSNDCDCPYLRSDSERILMPAFMHGCAHCSESRMQRTIWTHETDTVKMSRPVTTSQTNAFAA